MKTKHSLAPLAAFALLLAACTDSVAPNRTLLPNGVSLAVTQDLINFEGGGAYPVGVDDGYVILCKTGDAAGTFNFNVTVDGVPQTDVTRTLGAGGGTDCGSGPIFVSAANNGLGDFSTVTITEDGQDNWANTDIDVVQHLALGIFNANGYPAAALLDDDGTTTAGQATVFVNDDMARTVTFTNDFTPPPVGNEGCTPGFWKNNADKKSASQWPVPTNTLFSTVFGANNDLPGTTTLLQALNLGGGGINALARHAAAAYLNVVSSGVDYAYTEAELIALVANALSTNNYETAKNLLAAANEAGCPIDQNP